jgi:hypothetical protein
MEEGLDMFQAHESAVIDILGSNPYASAVNSRSLDYLYNRVKPDRCMVHMVMEHPPLADKT